MRNDPVKFFYASPLKCMAVITTGLAVLACYLADSLRKPDSFFDCASIWMLLLCAGQIRTIRHPIIVITETGLRDRRWTSREIPWTAVTDMGIHTVCGWKIVTLHVDPAYPDLPLWALTRLRIRAQLSRRVTAWCSRQFVDWLGLGDNGMWISARILNVDLETLYAAIGSRMRHARTSHETSDETSSLPMRQRAEDLADNAA